MIEKAQIGRVLDRLSAVEAAMGDPSVVADAKRYRETVREHTALKKLEASAKRYFKLLDDIEGAESMLSDPDLDPELLSEAQSEVEELKSAIPDAERDVLAGLLPPDPLEGRNACFEIRAGTGGEEAALFAGNLFRMYSRYCEAKGWKIRVMSANQTSLDGYKEGFTRIRGIPQYLRRSRKTNKNLTSILSATKSRNPIIQCTHIVMGINFRISTHKLIFLICHINLK